MIKINWLWACLIIIWLVISPFVIIILYARFNNFFLPQTYGLAWLSISVYLIVGLSLYFLGKRADKKIFEGYTLEYFSPYLLIVVGVLLLIKVLEYLF